jgi:hypothetical protein
MGSGEAAHVRRTSAQSLRPGRVTLGTSGATGRRPTTAPAVWNGCPQRGVMNRSVTWSRAGGGLSTNVTSPVAPKYARVPPVMAKWPGSGDVKSPRNWTVRSPLSNEFVATHWNHSGTRTLVQTTVGAARPALVGRAARRTASRASRPPRSGSRLEAAFCVPHARASLAHLAGRRCGDLRAAVGDRRGLRLITASPSACLQARRPGTPLLLVPQCDSGPDRRRKARPNTIPPADATAYTPPTARLIPTYHATSTKPRLSPGTSSWSSYQMNASTAGMRAASSVVQRGRRAPSAT